MADRPRGRESNDDSRSASLRGDDTPTSDAWDPEDTSTGSQTVRLDSRRQPVVPTPDGGLQIGLPSIFHAATERFQLDGILGRGGTSRVYAAFDEDLERELAIKVVPQDGGLQDQLAREARMTSSLSHPNVPPVFDVGRVGDDYFLALPRIRGRSLRALIREAARCGHSSALPTHELVEMFLKVCDALAYAHARGIVHKDIKPDNIMIGDYGEVMLVDWGSAATLGEAHDPTLVVGTPAYMAPEQCLGEPLDPRFDVYAFGATLFHALLLRKPVTDVNVQRMQERKLSGELDPPTRDELARTPRALLAVALRALHARPEDRYQSIPELASDLRDYLAGGRNWSAPIAEETFQDEDWQRSWISVEPGAFERRRVPAERSTRRTVPPPSDGARTPTPVPEPPNPKWALESRAQRGALLFYRERVSGGIAIELEGSMLEDATPGDISVVWTEDDVLSDGRPRWPRQGSRTICFQVGALSNHLVGIFRDFHQPLAARAMRLEPGRAYRIRAEIADHVLRLSIDGELVAEYEERLPLRSGYVALYAYYPGKRFARVRVQQRGLPENVSPLAVGDAFYARDLFDAASEEYERVELGQGNPQLVAQARYKRGLCELKRGDSRAAFELWAELKGPDWAARIALHRAELAFEQGRHAVTLQTLASVLVEHPAQRRRAVQLWTDLVRRLIDHDDLSLERYLALRAAHFSDDPSTRALVARALLALGRFEQVVQEYAGERIEYCDALLALGLFDEILEKHADMTGLCDATRVRQGLLERVSSSERSQPSVLIVQGRTKEAAALSDMATVVLAAGHHARVLQLPDAGPLERTTALVRMGRMDEALALGHPLAHLAAGRPREALACARTLQFRVRALHHAAIEAFLDGDVGAFQDYWAQARSAPFSHAWEDMWCDRFLLIPLCEELSGRVGAVASSLERVMAQHELLWGQRAFHVAAFVLGRVEEADFLRQPARGGARARLSLARAVRADMAGRRQEARASYQQLLACPEPERFIDSIYLSPSCEMFAARRAAAL